MFQVRLFSHRTECPLVTTESGKDLSKGVPKNKSKTPRPKAKISGKWRSRNSYSSLSPVFPASPPTVSSALLKSCINLSIPVVTQSPFSELTSPVSFSATSPKVVESPKSLFECSKQISLSSPETNRKCSILKSRTKPLLFTTTRFNQNQHSTNNNTSQSVETAALKNQTSDNDLINSSSCSTLPLITPPNTFAHYSWIM